MKKIIRIFSIYLILGNMMISSMTVFGQMDKKYSEYVKKAFEANSASECLSSLKYCNEMLKVVPDHPVINFLSARLNEQLGNRDIALKHLKKAARLGYTSDARWLKIHPMNDPSFGSLRKEEAYLEIIEIMNIANEPVHKSRIAFTVNKKDLGPTYDYEGITYDPVDKMFFLGSDHVIVKVDHSGKSTAFTSETKEDGLEHINGIHVDPVRRTLWACSNDENYANGEIFKYDLSTGKLIKKYKSPADSDRHFFNDLVILPNGDVYITDTGIIWVIPNVSDKLEIFVKTVTHGFNGITVSDDSRAIFASSNLGIYKINIETKSGTFLTHEKDFHTYGIDGIYFDNNYLYVVENELLSQISRFSLNGDATHIESCEFFEKNTPDLSTPCTGVLADDYFYFIARENQEELIIMKAPLK
jgi:sugar lactone lactonase YvrE